MPAASRDDALEAPDRLAALEENDLLDLMPEDVCDRFTRLAERSLNAAASTILFVDEDRLFTSAEGRGDRGMPLLRSFCARVVSGREPLLIEDAREEEEAENDDEPVAEHSAVEEEGVIAYAGVPLVTDEGHVLGSFCVTDTEPRAWTPGDVALLEDLAAAVMDRLVLERKTRRGEQERQREREEALRRAKADAEAASAAKSRFVANMSHELRTPLNTVIGYSDMFREAPAEFDPERIKQGFERIHNSGQQLLDLINDVLDLSHAESGRMGVSLETLDLATFTAAVAEEMRPAVQDNENTFEVEGLDTVGEVCIDRAKLRSIFYNLLSNAGKYTTEGTVTLTVGVQTSGSAPPLPENADLKGDTEIDEDGENRELVISVADTGVGLTGEEQDRIFDAFERAESAHNVRGTGLGLQIVQNLCALMGGRVEVESEMGVGSTFTARLPAGPVPPGKREDAASRRRGGGRRGGTPAPRGRTRLGHRRRPRRAHPHAPPPQAGRLRRGNRLHRCRGHRAGSRVAPDGHHPRRAHGRHGRLGRPLASETRRLGPAARARHHGDDYPERGARLPPRRVRAHRQARQPRASDGGAVRLPPRRAVAAAVGTHHR